MSSQLSLDIEVTVAKEMSLIIYWALVVLAAICKEGLLLYMIATALE